MNDTHGREARLATTPQTHQLMATLATGAAWSHIPPEAIQELIRDPERAGELFTAFIAQGLSAALAREPCSRAFNAFRPHWYQQNGIIYAKMVSTGWKAEEWVVWFRENNYELPQAVQDLLLSGRFKPTRAGVSRRIGIIAYPGCHPDEWIMPKIMQRAEGFHFDPADLETLCLFRKSFSDKEMDAMGSQWYVAAHEPVDESGRRLIAGTVGNGRWISFAKPLSDEHWPHYSAFIFNRK